MLFNPDSGKEKPDKPRKRKWTPPTPDPELVARVVASWKRYLEGLWLSGLRLTESRELYWDRDDKLRVDLTGRRPMMRIPAELEKGHKDRLLPITPDFAEFLLRTPKGERRGRVFPLVPQRKRDGQPHWRHVSKVISDIGKAAGVKVYTNPRTKAVKCASAHDLRRSFGARWARRVVPHVLMELMRHEDIKTTNDYYATHDAEATADVVWAAFEQANQPTASAAG
ncbi:MAG: site-specific integrase [Planctomycetes bacterium]|nr:site-specific integrase [Planctomycetota bacterium]